MPHCTFQQVKEVSARRISEGSTFSTTRIYNAAITSLTLLKLHHTAPFFDGRLNDVIKQKPTSYRPCRPYRPYHHGHLLELLL
jgi:hypothetical protein